MKAQLLFTWLLLSSALLGQSKPLLWQTSMASMWPMAFYTSLDFLYSTTKPALSKTKPTHFLLSIPGQAAANFLEKDWVGQLSLLGHTEFVRITEKDGKTSLILPYAEAGQAFSLTHVIEDAKRIQFTIKRGIAEWKFDGDWVSEQQLKGTLSTNGVQGTFDLHQHLPIDSSTWQTYLGDYRIASGEVFKVWDRFNTFRIHSPLSQEVSRLYKIGEHEFFTTSGEDIHFSNPVDGQFQTLEWRLADGQKQTASREQTYSVEELIITTMGDTIGASLYLPNLPGKHPGSIIVRGAGNFDRSINLTDAEVLANHGIAVLVYDNHGNGLSNGSLMEKTFIDKQKLVVELFNWMQQHPQIEPLKIGLIGGSQGARIAAMAASELPTMAFLSLRAHPMETRKDQQLYAISAFMRQQNVQETVIVKALALWDRFFDLAAQQAIDAAFVEELSALRAQHPRLMLPTANAENPPFFPLRDDIYNATKDYLSTIKCPVLSAHGTLDDRVPAQKSVFYLREGLKTAGNDQLTVLFYEGAGHSFQLPGFRIAPGFFMNEVRWIRTVLGMN